MYFGSNLQYLRKQRSGMTQETLAQHMGVSRQTVSKWESEDACPEISKLIELCDIFSCTLDSLLREDMAARDASPLRIVRVERFRMARYIMISPQAERDVCTYMDNWAIASGLTVFPGYVPKHIHWGFPHVSPDQKDRFGLRGHAAACILPENFTPVCGGAEIAIQQEACYAVMTLRSPFPEDIIRGAQAYPLMLEYMHTLGIPKNGASGFLPCFEREYQESGLACKDYFIHCADSPSAEPFRFD